MIRRRASRDDGLTVVEMSIALAMTMLIVFSVLSALDFGTRSERGQQARSEALTGLRTAMQRMTKDVRQAVSISPASTRDRLVLRTIIAGTETDMTYEVNGENELLRIVEGIPPGIPLATNVAPTGLFCFDAPSCSLNSPEMSTLTRIRITLINSPSVGDGPPVTLATDVELRNI